MKRSISILAFFLPSAISICAQTPVDNRKEFIEWNEFYKLQWDDFQGKPDAESAGDAGTAVQIKAKPYQVKKEVKYDVYAFFNKKKSWYRATSAELLAHESLHFDIAELYARKIRKKVSELDARNVKEVKVYNAAINELLQESNAADMQYDLETLHGALPKQQLEWKQKIKKELTSLKAYKKRRQIISAD